MTTPLKSGRFAESKGSRKTDEPAGTSGSGTSEEQNRESGTGEWPAHLTARDASAYIHEMAIELKALAESAKLSFLAYLLALVVEESALHKRGRL